MRFIKIPIFLFFLSFALSGFCVSEVQDTLLNTDTPAVLVITEHSEGTLVKVKDRGSEHIDSVFIPYSAGSNVTTTQKTSGSVFKLPVFGYDSREREGLIATISGLCIGLTNPIGQTGGRGIQWSKSFEISWLNCIAFGYNFSRSRLTLGLGFDWRNYKSTIGNHWLVTDGNGGIEWGAAPNGVHVRSTELHVFSLQMPLMYTWSIPKTRMVIRAAPIVCFNTSSSVKGIFNDAAGNKLEYYSKDFKRNPVTVDFFGALVYQGVGIYVRYSPMKVLKNTSTINFNPFTIGFGFLI